MNIVVPSFGESVVEARIAHWLKKEGDKVENGDALVELETEKVNVDVTAETAGFSPGLRRTKRIQFTSEM